MSSESAQSAASGPSEPQRGENLHSAAEAGEPLSGLLVEQDPPPITLAVIGRLFGVPLLIISTIVGGAVVVVLLFGAPTMPERLSVDQLVQSLESSSGERSLGILLPREKQLWQTSLELCERLTQQGSEFADDELVALAGRLSALVHEELKTVENLPTTGAERGDQRRVRGSRLEFVVRALGRTRRPEAVPALIEVVRSKQEPFAAVAARELGDLRDVPGARDAVDEVIDLLPTAEQNETRLIAVTVLSVLAEKGDPRAIEALRAARIKHEGEVAWAASLALARLGSLDGRATLLDLLDRGFWEQGERYETTDSSGQTRRYRMPEARVEQWLLAALEACSGLLGDAELRAAVERLGSDSSLRVRGRADEILRGSGTQ